MRSLVPDGCALRLRRRLGLWGVLCMALVGAVMAAMPLTATAPDATERHDGDRSAAWLLADGQSALAARLWLIQRAERSLDLQYYIWHDDIAGALLFDAVRRAADRGVQVRLLLDDNNTSGMDGLLAALDAHARIEVRLFNANSHRNWRWLGYLTDFSRMNRRMHNKSITADGRATIVGGRNVGDAYFGLGNEALFADLDVLAAGPVAREVTDEFEKYWNSEPVQPVGPLLEPAEPGVLEALASRAQAILASPAAHGYNAALTDGSIAHRLQEGRTPDAWAAIQVLSDDPAKGLGPVPTSSLLTFELAQGQQPARRSLHLVSPYFVPSEAGMRWFRQLRQQGLEVVVLTNSLSATDVALVHSGYARYRRELLNIGAQVWELKRTPFDPTKHGAAAIADAGSSSASLHAKTFIQDCESLFVGSFNFDPRSALLNTEMGVTLHAPDLAKTSCEQLQANLPARAYRVTLRPDGELEWWDDSPQGRQVWTEEPLSSAWQRIGLGLLSWLPVEWLL